VIAAQGLYPQPVPVPHVSLQNYQRTVYCQLIAILC